MKFINITILFSSSSLDYLTQNHDCPPSPAQPQRPPTRGPVMIFVCEREEHTRARTRTHTQGESRSAAADSLLVSRVSCSPASRRGDRAHGGLCNVLRHGCRCSQSQRSAQAACAKEATPLDQSETRSSRVYTQRHMAGPRCPCDWSPGGVNTVELCPKKLATLRRSGTANPFS